MKCNIVEENIVAFIEDDMEPRLSAEVKDHIETCDSCRKLMDETKSMLKVFGEVAPHKPSGKVRQGFLELLEEEKNLQRFTIGKKETKEFPWKTAFQIAASILLLIGGYTMGSFHKASKSNVEIAKLIDETSQLKQDMMLAMLDNRSASKRIQAVNYTEDIAMPDSDVMEALIDRMHFDGNVNVRLAAVEALSKYSKNEKVKNAFIKSLTNEKNPNIQIAVIQFLVEVQEKRARVPMQKLLEHSETPSFVKDQVNDGLITLM